MSAILAGTCRKCGQEFWESLGHPKWFKDWLRSHTETRQVLAYKKLRTDQLCSTCAPLRYAQLLGG